MPLGRRRNRIERSLRERGVPPEPQHRPRDVVETGGPWDDTDAPDDGRQRVDLGALRVPVVPGMELRLEVAPDQQIVGATVVLGDSTLSVAAFAAPRAGGVWNDVRAELARTASGQGGSLREVDGPFGPELAGTVAAMTQAAEGSAPTQVRLPARFLGVDGPRWFLRGTVLGPAGAGGEAARTVEETFRDVVVVRGNEPMPVREPLPLVLPAQAAEQLAEQGDDQPPREV
jgi:Protein of unknown function (DUF3710)